MDQDKKQVESPTQKDKQKTETSSKKEKMESRKIPETVIQPYDLVTLQEPKKKRFNFKKSESKQQLINNEELQKLVPLFGECSCSEDMREQFEATIYNLTSSLFLLSKVCSFRIRSVSKIKLIADTASNSKPVLIKVTWDEKEDEGSDILVRLKSPEEAYFLFSSLISRKLLLDDFSLVDIGKGERKNFIGGIKHLESSIYKVSTFMRKWQKRQASIDDTLKLYKELKVSQEIRSIKQIWTRFDMHNGYFVVKMFEGLEKIELGIPLGDYSNIESDRNWLYLLCRLMK